MTQVSIIGTGNMANAIGGVLADGGSSVTYITQEQTGTAPLSGEIVVLAVPYPAVDEHPHRLRRSVRRKDRRRHHQPAELRHVRLAHRSGRQLRRRRDPVEAAGGDRAQGLQHDVRGNPGGQAGRRPSTTVLIAGDDTSAKQTLAAAVEAGGVSAIDAGSLSRAHELEALGFLQLTLAAGEKISWTGGFAVAR